MTVACLVREKSIRLYPEMTNRWTASKFPGAKTTTTFMKDEVFKFTFLVTVIGQLSIFAGLVVYANDLFSLAHADVLDF